ncbi:hypothetical protein NDS46_16380 [Paenibacillus thiaminolyticus]|nr:hypothetical protein [Paenibacillus thiaminolyticus]WCF05950.1 hypothetical protein NDS46_16380 [Paenibacillus thiaminolyticus]
MDKLKECDLDTAKAYRMRLILREIYRFLSFDCTYGASGLDSVGAALPFRADG